MLALQDAVGTARFVGRPDSLGWRPVFEEFKPTTFLEAEVVASRLD